MASIDPEDPDTLAAISKAVEEVSGGQRTLLPAESDAPGDLSGVLDVDADVARLISAPDAESKVRLGGDKRWSIVHLGGDDFGCFELDAYEEIAKKHRILGEPQGMELHGKRGYKAGVFFKPEEVCLMKENGICDILKFADQDTPGSFLHSVKEPKKDKLLENAHVRAMALKRKKQYEDAGLPPPKRQKLDPTEIEVTEEEVAEALAFLKTRCPEQSPDKYLVNDYFIHADLSEVLQLTVRLEHQRLVYADLWRRGFMLTPGSKFGCDYLVYDGRPNDVHSDFMCHVMTENDVVTPRWIRTYTRLARSVKKQIMLAVVWADKKVTYTRHADWDDGFTGKGKVKRIEPPVIVNSKSKTDTRRKAEEPKVGSSVEEPASTPPESWDDVIAAIDKYPKFNKPS
uniref:tRNA-intron lyase n=1 Tax=Panagrellus redivivus TaxID=6233 RepID=A0A7E4VN37_PANRE